ncbi:MAG: hypothetical protein WC795_01040 [Candidatus Paceibacterota bacterium]|jgi:hypothetical protein
MSTIFKHTKLFFKRNSILIVSLASFAIFSSGLQLLASFSPGQTLDPNCTPGSVDCTVDVSNTLSKGTSWTSRTSAADNEWNNVAYGNGLFVAVAGTGSGNRVMTSPDGINWTIRTSAVDNQWVGITYGNGLFVAISADGTSNRVMTSPDGITWTSRTSAADNTWRDVTYSNGLFVAVASTGSGNRVMTSPDGITWTSRTSAADNSWLGVTYGNGLFVAVSTTGSGNRVMTSPDGITWTSRTSAVDNNWIAVTYGNGLFVAVSNTGTSDRVMTSPDGITWTSRTSAADNSWFGITYGNGLFVAIGASGTGNRVMTSPDGITWVTRTSVADNIWEGITYGNGMFVAVSNTGTGNRVMTSGKTDYIAISLNNIYQGGMNIMGNVGIGTTAPLSKIHVSETTAVAVRGIMSAQYSTNTLGSIFLGRKARGTEAIPTTIVTGDRLTSFVAEGYDGTNFKQMGSIDFAAEGTIGTDRVPTNVSFSTATDASPSVLTERMRIDSAGNMGIGTTAPTEILDIQSNTSATRALRLGFFSNTNGSSRLKLQFSRSATKGGQTIVNNADNIGELEFQGSDGVTFQQSALIRSSVDGVPGVGSMPGRLMFYTTPTGTNTGTERMRIDSAGNVGIGTTTPTAQLQTLGGTTSSGAVTMTAVDTATTFTTSSSVTLNAGDYIIPTTTTGQARAIVTTATGTSFTITPAFTAGVTGETYTIHRSTANFTNSSGTSSLFVQGSTGNLGIGTTTPIKAGAGFRGITITNANSVLPVMEFWSNSDAISNGADLNGLNWWVGATTPVNTARIGLENFGTAENAGSIYFSTATGGTLIERMRITNTGDITFANNDFGSGAAGPVLTLGRNTNATPGAGSINFQSNTGTAGYTWQDAAGKLRIHTAAPTNANDTAGVVVGDQTSTRDTKQDITPYTDPSQALDKVVSAPLRMFRYIKEVQGYGTDNPLSKAHLGFIADEVDPLFMQGNSIDQVSVNGLLMGSVQALDLRLKGLETLDDGTGSSTLKKLIMDYLFSTEEKIVNGVVRVQELIANTITAQKGTFDKIELKDEDTGTLYCIKIKNGSLSQTAGDCNTNQSYQDPSPAPDPAPTPDPAPISDPVPDPITPPIEESDPAPTPDPAPISNPEPIIP